MALNNLFSLRFWVGWLLLAWFLVCGTAEASYFILSSVNSIYKFLFTWQLYIIIYYHPSQIIKLYHFKGLGIFMFLNLIIWIVAGG